MTLSSRAPFSRQVTRGPGAWRDAIKIQFTMRFPHPLFFELCTPRFPFFPFLSGGVTRRSGIGEIGMRNARQEKVNQKVVPFFPPPPPTSSKSCYGRSGTLESSVPGVRFSSSAGGGTKLLFPHFGGRKCDATPTFLSIPHVPGAYTQKAR